MPNKRKVIEKMTTFGHLIVVPATDNNGTTNTVVIEWRGTDFNLAKLVPKHVFAYKTSPAIHFDSSLVYKGCSLIK